MLSRQITQFDHLSTILVFLEFLVANALSDRVMNYVLALNYTFGSYGWSIQVFYSPLVKRLLKGVNYTVQSIPNPKGLLTLLQICEISHMCEIYEASLTYRAAFLLAFYGLLRISNIAPPFSRAFDPQRHLFSGFQVCILP